jgi:predicted enzyme related to lactoylglutathione lyase
MVMPNPLFHWELMVNDVPKAIEFYSKVFDWEIDEKSVPTYPLIKTGNTPGGAFFGKPSRVPECALNTYFYVEDIEETLTRAQALGATILAPKTPIIGLGYWAMFADPDGIHIGLLQPE